MNQPDLNLPDRKKVKVVASPWKRSGAYLFDMILLSLITFPIQRTLIVQDNTSFLETIRMALENPEFGSKLMIVEFIFAAIIILYFVILEYSIKQSVGKMLFKIYVENDAQKGNDDPLKDAKVTKQSAKKESVKKLTVWQMFARNMFMIPFLPFSVLGLMDPFFMFFRRDHKRFSDMLAKTNVVEYVEID